jgi:hypothetical protein
MAESRTDELLALARRTPANLRHFFERLSDPGWLEVLDREGFFANPPGVETTEDDDGTWIRFPDWPASSFLVRVAAAAPETVARIIAALPETDNVRIHEDIVRAAAEMPSDCADRLAEGELRWFADRSGPLLAYPHLLAKLGVELLRLGRPELGTAIFDAVLSLHGGGSPGFGPGGLTARMSEWEYKQALSTIWPALLDTQGLEGLRFLASKVLAAVGLSQTEHADDISHLWRKAIEDHAQNIRDTVFDALVSATRDMAIAGASNDPKGVFDLLSEFDSPIFERLRLHVLRVLGDQLAEATAGALLDRRMLEDPRLWHEYAELLRARFAQLDSNEQAQLLRLIRAGTQEEAADETPHGDALRASRRYMRLAVIADHLTGDALADYRQLVDWYGPPDHPEFLTYTSTVAGPASHLSKDDVSLRSPADLVAFLHGWEPDQTLGPHSSHEGFGRILAEAIADAPESYAADAALFAGVDPTFVRAFFTGLEQAARAGRAFSWQPPLELAKWVVDQPQADAAQSFGMERDTTWSWTRNQIARLLARGLEVSEAELPPDTREAVWSLLAALAEDPDPRRSAESNGDGLDAASRSLNVTRGEAMHSVVRYVAWVERLDGGAFRGLASVPEAKAVLEAHLDPKSEPSTAVRAVYGMWLAQLIRIDATWVSEHAEDIFPSDPSLAPLFSGAWDSYVVYTRPWLAVLPIIERAYALGIARMSQEPRKPRLSDPPEEKLGEHLVWYAVMSAVEIDEPGLWQEYWNHAPIRLRQHAVAYLGQLFKDTDVVDDAVRERAHELWSWIADNVESAQRAEVLAPFAWLLYTGVMDDAWLLPNAVKLLNEGVHLDPAFVVWTALTRTVETDPATTAAILRLMVQTDPRGWSVLGSEESVRRVLEVALRSDDPDAMRRARDAINILGARGVDSFRELLTPGN